MISCLSFSVQQSPYEKVSTLKEEFTPFQKGGKTLIAEFAELASLKVYPFHLTHCGLNRLSHTIYWKSLISILGMSSYEIYIFLEKNA